MKNASLPDWIQAAAVLTGVAFAIYELRFSQRELDRERAEYAFSLLGRMEQPAVLEAGQILERLAEVDSAEEALEALRTVNRALYPFAYCYAQGLCPPDLALRMICPSLAWYAEAADDVTRAYGRGTRHVGEHRLVGSDLWTECEVPEG